MLQKSQNLILIKVICFTFIPALWRQGIRCPRTWMRQKSSLGAATWLALGATTKLYALYNHNSLLCVKLNGEKWKKTISKRMINDTTWLTNILYMPYKDGRRLLVWKPRPENATCFLPIEMLFFLVHAMFQGTTKKLM